MVPQGKSDSTVIDIEIRKHILAERIQWLFPVTFTLKCDRPTPKLNKALHHRQGTCLSSGENHVERRGSNADVLQGADTERNITLTLAPVLLAVFPVLLHDNRRHTAEHDVQYDGLACCSIVGFSKNFGTSIRPLLILAEEARAAPRKCR